MKSCTKCGESKPESAFHRNSAAKDGLRADCKECVKARVRAHYAANQERERERKRAYSRAGGGRTKEQHRDSMRQWRAANRERDRQTSQRNMKRWRAKHPAEARSKWHERRSKTPLTPELRKAIAVLLLQPCAYCGIEADSMTIDHIVPLARGGKHELSNLAPACTTCNFSKGAKLLEEWRPKAA